MTGDWLRRTGTLVHRASLVIAFLATFTLEVRVKAESIQLPVAKEFEQEPAKCWDDDGVCAVRSAAGERLELKLAHGFLHVAESSLVVRETDDRLRVLRGSAWIRTQDHLTVASEFGSIESEGGEFWVSRAPDRLTGAATEGTLYLLPRGSGERLEVGAGLENWIGHVQAGSGRAESGVPVSIDLKSHVVRWAKLYGGQRAEFEKEVAAFYQRWQTATQAAAEIHKSLYDRKMASVDALEARQAQVRRREKTRTDELIRLFRARTLEP